MPRIREFYRNKKNEIRALAANSFATTSLLLLAKQLISLLILILLL